MINLIHYINKLQITADKMTLNYTMTPSLFIWYQRRTNKQTLHVN